MLLQVAYTWSTRSVLSDGTWPMLPSRTNVRSAKSPAFVACAVCIPNVLYMTSRDVNDTSSVTLAFRLRPKRFVRSVSFFGLDAGVSAGGVVGPRNWKYWGTSP